MAKQHLMPDDKPVDVGIRGAAIEILFVCSDLEVGGTERQLAAIASALVQLGWRVGVYSMAGRGPLQAELERGRVTVILPPLNRPSKRISLVMRIFALVLAAAHLTFTLLKRRPAIVHFMLPEAYLVGAPLAILTRMPVKIMSRRSLNIYQKNTLVRIIERRLHRSMNAILGNSLSVIGQLKGEGVPSGRLGLIYNGIDPDAFVDSNARLSRRTSFGLEPNTFVMCIVANLIPYKGHRDLIDALGQVTKKMPASWHLLLAGRDDGIGTQLREQAERLGISKNISFLGLRSDIPALLAASDVGILCSHQEGFANAILEGMAAGLPMIVTNVGGNPEAVIDGVTGLVVPSSDPKRLAEAIVQLAENPAKRIAFGSAGRQRVIELFGRTRCIAAYDQLCRKLLVGGSPGDIAQIRVP
jgi:glycosyltransferase involved in cell wall biosynthesis